MALWELLTDYTFLTVLTGTMAIGGVSGAIGCFAYLRRQSLVGDVVAHSSLLGIMLFFLASYWLTGEGSKSLLVLIPGAMFSGIASLALTQWITSSTTVRYDSGLGVMLSIFFGTGILILRSVQATDSPIPGRRGLEDYIFGMAASMTRADLVMIGIVGSLSIVLVCLFWKELKVFAFDPVFAQSLGYRGRWLEFLMIAILVTGIVIGIQCIGVVLMIAMLIAPAASARQWTRTLGPMTILAAVIGAMCAAVGTFTSSVVADMPTGPVIVLAGTIVFVLSLLFAPGRGVLFSRHKRRNATRKFARVQEAAE